MSAQNIDARVKKILKQHDAVFGESWKVIKDRIPTSTYHNDSMSEDSSTENHVYLLDACGKLIWDGGGLAKVPETWSSRYSDGSYGGGSGKKVCEFVKQLSESKDKVAFVLWEGFSWHQDNSVVVQRILAGQNYDGREPEQKKTKPRKVIFIVD